MAALVAQEVAKLRLQPPAQPAAPHPVAAPHPMQCFPAPVVPVMGYPYNPTLEILGAMKQVLMEQPEGAVCYRCGQAGHIQRHCELFNQSVNNRPAQGAPPAAQNGPPGRQPGGQQGGGRPYFRGRGGRGRSRGCFRCGAESHWAQDCRAPEPRGFGTPNESRPQGAAAPGGQA
jgi:hypothetical protein